MSKIFKYVKKPWFTTLIVAVALVAVGIVIWSSRETPAGMKTFSFDNGGLKYSVLFYGDAKPVRLEDKSNALTSSGAVVMTVKPVDEQPIKDCTTIGTGWTEATSYEVEGKSGPVCAFGNGFATIISAHGSQHLMTVTYSKKQGSNINPVLQSIYGSLAVDE